MVSLPGSLVDVEGTGVFVHRRGTGPAVVLVHGFLMSHWYFRGIVPALAAQYDVIALDLPGFGESDRPPPERFPYGFDAFARTVLGLLDRLGVRRAALLGHSMGGAVALAVAARAPERVSALVLEDASAYPPPVPLLAHVALLPVLGEFLFQHGYTRGQLALGLKRFAYGVDHPMVAEMVDYWWERLCRPGGKAAAYAMMRVLTRSEPLVTEVGRLTVPVPALVVWGETDCLQPLLNGRRLARELEAPLRVVPCTGHTPHEERPAAFLQIISPFLSQVLAEQRGGRPESCRSAS